MSGKQFDCFSRRWVRRASCAWSIGEKLHQWSFGEATTSCSWCKRPLAPFAPATFAPAAADTSHPANLQVTRPSNPSPVSTLPIFWPGLQAFNKPVGLVLAAGANGNFCTMCTSSTKATTSQIPRNHPGDRTYSTVFSYTFSGASQWPFCPLGACLPFL